MSDLERLTDWDLDTSVLDDIEHRHWTPPGVDVAAVEVLARARFADSGQPQAVHHHAAGAGCVTGCHVIRWAEQ